MNLQNWLELNHLKGTIDSQILTLNDKQYFILQYEDKDSKILDERFEFILSQEQGLVISDNNLTDIVFEFGSKWYYSPIDEPKFNLLKYIGESTIAEQQLDIPYLGVHGKYDICNGSRDYKDWCVKSKFLGNTTLGIAESDTLAGTLSFQIACEGVGIKSIIGETITVKGDKDEQYKIKLYCINETGWRNLLNINAQIKVFNEGFVLDEYLFTRTDGLICVIDCSTKLTPKLIKRYKDEFEDDLYYQFDPVEWLGSIKEHEHLDLLKEYINKYIDQIKPVLICDSYYLDKDEAHIRKLLNTIGKIGFQNQSLDQYYKNINDIVFECDELFKDEDRSGAFINKLIDNTIELASKCDFKIKLGELHLPQYELTEEEKKEFDSPVSLFWGLIQKGLDEKVLGKVEDEQVYLDRIQEEVRVIEKGNLIDYFLIIWDILNYCKRNDILTSIGRGSAAGSLVSYLLGIVKADPIKYGLLFERFLSEARLGKSMPDVDSDLPSDKRDEVKRYIETRYGIDYVTSIGTYGTYKIKAAIKDVGKYYGAEFQKTNYITSFIPDDADFTEMFKIAQQSVPLKSFLQANPKVIEDYQLIANQQKTVSIHAAGIIIVPKTYKGQSMTIYDWMPVKMMDGVLVSEWEGQQLDAAGFLKADILGIAQLQKFSEIIALVKQNHGKVISFDDMNLEDDNVYHLFQEGLNEDVFQFGAMGLKNYCKELKPSNINDLIATVALYRPGPMESGTHKEYIKIKNGLKQPEYDYMLEDVTKDTHSMIIYQEQLMKAVNILGGMSLVEAEDVRKVVGKSDFEKMKGYRDKFIQGAIKNNCSELEAIRIWNKLESFGKYAFNKSHSTAYALVGYFSQWLKYTYPIEFWSVSLHHSKSDEISRRIAEINKVSTVKVLPPDINNSTDVFKSDFATDTIYWSISSIKFIGEKAMTAITEEKNKNGQFFSFEEFYSRVTKTGVNKRGILNLILSGCFDQLEKVKNPSDRISIVRNFIRIAGIEMPEDLSDPTLLAKDYYWILKQKELTGFGYFDFENIYKTNSALIKNIRYLDPTFLQGSEFLNKQGCLVGILTEVIERKSKKGPFAQITINSNDENVICLVWSEIWEDFKTLLLQSKNKIIFITGEVKEDSYRKINILQTNLKTKIEIL